MPAPVAIIDGEEMPIARLDRAMVEAMAEAGALSDLGRVELIDGVLVHVSPAKSPHGNVLMKIGSRLEVTIGDRFDIGTDIGVFFGETTMRAPDILVCPRDIEPGFREPDDIVLAVEISDSTRNQDIRAKARLYGISGLPEYWIVDLVTRTVHRHRDPSPEGYRSIETLDWTAPLAPLCAPDAPFRLVDVLKGVRL